MLEDAVARRGSVVTGEVSYRSARIREAQGVTQGRLMRCEKSDESIVVMKSRPMKAGNRLEDKTGTTGGLFAGACICQKRCRLRREEVYSNVLGKIRIR